MRIRSQTEIRVLQEARDDEYGSLSTFAFWYLSRSILKPSGWSTFASATRTF